MANPSTRTREEIIVIGYGNSLRSDDGVGPRRRRPSRTGDCRACGRRSAAANPGTGRTALDRLSLRSSWMPDSRTWAKVCASGRSNLRAWAGTRAHEQPVLSARPRTGGLRFTPAGVVGYSARDGPLCGRRAVADGRGRARKPPSERSQSSSGSLWRRASAERIPTYIHEDVGDGVSTAMRIGLLTSGGDAPGMNACIRAVVRTALPRGHQVIGVRRGYEGLLEETFYYSFHRKDFQMDLRSVSNIIQRGGTILHTSRCERFETEEGQQAAADGPAPESDRCPGRHRRRWHVPRMSRLAGYWDRQIIGCPGTIDNDLWGTDTSIGFTTAVSTAAEAVDKIRDTAEATERLFLVEVMGRKSGQIALYSALATGADAVLLPEVSVTIENVVRRLEDERRLGKTSWIVIVAEGALAGGVHKLRQEIVDQGLSFDTRVVVLGHLQRGGGASGQIASWRVGWGLVQWKPWSIGSQARWSARYRGDRSDPVRANLGRAEGNPGGTDHLAYRSCPIDSSMAVTLASARKTDVPEPFS